ncbi:MAG: LON peptidase substrate-binding domain-containing protein [Gammaproteobacteria bacterium]|nr:LON peptidase substrate-binding domain-containing protein [Gammaproteobacteria bacterium]
MSKNPFITPFESLPDTLPIFPLPGAIVMPGAELPLNIFEPRYLNMINDAMASHRMIGMIQPQPDAQDEGLCITGCAGRITQYRETADGRIELVLTGVCRFDLGDELATTRGYRLVVPDWDRFAQDYVDDDERAQHRHTELIEALTRFFDVKNYEADMPMLQRLPTVRLVDSLTIGLPFSEAEKQMMLETVDGEARVNSFIALIDGELDIPESVTRH